MKAPLIFCFSQPIDGSLTSLFYGSVIDIRILAEIFERRCYDLVVTTTCSLKNLNILQFLLQVVEQQLYRPTLAHAWHLHVACSVDFQLHDREPYTCRRSQFIR
jgi:hypothetical protein